jgi:hypothetical protein
VIAPRLEWALGDALAQGGCPVCALLRQDEQQHWEGFLYESFQDAGAPRAARASLGYCARHQAQLEERRDDVPGATMALAAVEGALDRLAASARPRRRLWKRRHAETERNVAPCPVCVRLAGTQANAIAELTDQLDRGTALAERFAASQGLCVDHLLAAESDAGEALRSPTERALGEVAADLRRLLESYDYRHESAAPDLVAAWHRAFQLIRDEPGAIRVS